MDELTRRRLIEHVRESIVGAATAISTPYGLRRVTYADYTASGRSVEFIEDFIRREVMPLYANTHTETSGTGRQTTRFREEARALIKEAVGAGPADALIFCGSGATAAIDKLLDVLQVRIPNDLDAKYSLRHRIPEAERPVVFIGPYEHHSNELPWRESIATVVVIDEDGDGQIDQQMLARELRHYEARPLKIGSFSAASNVTGISSDTQGVTRLLHAHGALALWDFAAAGPYVKIDMNPAGVPELAMDAIVLSPHKFPGGPGTPGILVAKRKLFANRVPAVPGGGTVRFVNHLEHRYVDDIEQREEGGTPAIIESIRAGLVFQLKRAVGEDAIMEREQVFSERAVAAWRSHPNIRILGSDKGRRLSIVSFMVRYGRGYLHHNFVVALLNDLFGIQARGGCSCAGPYGHRLLGIDLLKSRAYEDEILKGCEGIKPGWVRVNFNYFISEATFDFVIEAVRLVASEGHALLPDYVFEPLHGGWEHAGGTAAPTMSLRDLSYQSGRLQYRSSRSTEPEEALGRYLDEARVVIGERVAAFRARKEPPAPHATPFGSLRWFPLPHEVVADLAKRAP